MIKQLNNGSISTETEPQKIVDTILNNLKIEFKREEPFGFFTVDNYLQPYNLIIEVQGDYWHTNPKKFTSSITKVQYDRIGRDKAKHSYIKNQYGIDILYLWESDITSNVDLCIKLIQYYIENNGNIEDYHSFNYYIENGVLLLNKNVVIPYQNMPLEQYKSILNVKK